MCGLGDIDVNDWKKNTMYKSGKQGAGEMLLNCVCGKVALGQKKANFIFYSWCKKQLVFIFKYLEMIKQDSNM